ncbi:MAG TPA: diphosphate--fructose-6-phosphate 1-phosphotransferase, partial [Gammaproteobacteria bacterium]|nr:diphosphate--fructose-6-phosphate 1-phosphotransferase [Gammaproteobacteria bacterium]
MRITTLGEARFPSPQRRTINDQARVSSQLIRDPDPPSDEEHLFEIAGPRDRLFFDPQQTRAGIVTCGGLCPGLNNVIRSVFLELYYGYGVKDVLGFRGGYQGLDPVRGLEPVVLTPTFVHDIHKDGGTALGTSRGPVDIGLAVDNLIQRGVNILFTIGGDGTQRGGNALFQEAQRRGHPLAVVGIPKTIDNDVAFVSRTFGYLTAV